MEANEPRVVQLFERDIASWDREMGLHVSLRSDPAARPISLVAFACGTWIVPQLLLPAPRAVRRSELDSVFLRLQRYILHVTLLGLQWMTHPKANPLEKLMFTAIDSRSPNVLLYQPGLESGSKINASHHSAFVNVIILATWLGGASASRIAVYCRRYQAAHPAASILLLRTVLSDIPVKSSAAVQAQLQPARTYLLNAFPPGRACSDDKAILLS